MRYVMIEAVLRKRMDADQFMVFFLVSSGIEIRKGDVVIRLDTLNTDANLCIELQSFFEEVQSVGVGEFIVEQEEPDFCANINGGELVPLWTSQIDIRIGNRLGIHLDTITWIGSIKLLFGSLPFLAVFPDEIASFQYSSNRLFPDSYSEEF